MYQIKQLGASLFGRERRRPSTRLRLESLEERCLLSGGITSLTGLVNAISTANSSGSPTTITLEADTTFDFRTANNSTNGGNALPVITGNITIVGNGDTIERNIFPSLHAVFRLFDVASGGSLTLENLTLQFGLAEGQGEASQGGAIFASGALTLTGVTLQNNAAEAIGSGNAYGGGIYYLGGGSVFLSNCTISQNHAVGVAGANAGSGSNGGYGGEGAGGGVCVYGASGVNLVNDTFKTNQALGGQAGNAGEAGTGGLGGTARGGGLFVYNTPTALISSDDFTNNEAIGGHGGTGGTSSAVGYGGNGGLAQGGGLFVDASNLTLNADSISDNAAVGGNGGNGRSFPPPSFIGPGGSGGSAFGGGVYTTNLASSLPVLLGTMIKQDTVMGGAAGQPGAGPGQQSPVPGGTAGPLFYGSAVTFTPNSPLPRGTVGTPYYQTITALPLNSGSSPTVSYSLTFSSLGLNFNADGNQLIISGTPTTAGPVTFTVTATDSNGSTQPQFYVLTINPQPPAFTSAATTAFTVGQVGSFTVTATGSPRPSLSESGALPAGVSFTDNGNGTAKLGGTPAAGTQGTYHFSITAWNGVGSAFTQSFTLTVNPANGGNGGGGSVTLNVPPLLAFFDNLLGGVETVNGNGTETITDYLFGFPLLVSTFDHSGNLVSVTLFGFDVTFLFG